VTDDEEFFFRHIVVFLSFVKKEMNSGLYRVCLGRFDWATSAWHGDSSVIISLTFSSAGATSESLDTFENSFGGTFGRRI